MTEQEQGRSKVNIWFSYLRAILLIFGVLLPPAHSFTISDIRVSNHSSSSVTISWVTSSVTDGIVNYGLTTALGKSASDARADDDTHWVQIEALAPETIYYFEVVSGDVIDDNGGDFYTFTTTKIGAGVSYLIYGKVLKQDGFTPADGTIVYVTVTHNSNESYPLSSVTDSSGNWSVNLGNLKNPSTNDIFSYSAGDAIHLFAQGAADGTGVIEDSVSGESPQLIQPDVVLHPLLGDVSGDLRVTAFDAALILRYVVGDIQLPDLSYPAFTKESADVSRDGTISAFDAALILQYVVGLIDHFPKEAQMPP